MFGIGGNNDDDLFVSDGASLVILGGESSGFYPGEMGEDDIQLLSGSVGDAAGDIGNDVITLEGAAVAVAVSGDTVDFGFFPVADLALSTGTGPGIGLQMINGGGLQLQRS